MVAFWEESQSENTWGERREMWGHRGSDAFYAVRILSGAVKGACRLSAALLKQRHALSISDFDPALGARLAARRNEFAVVDQW